MGYYRAGFDVWGVDINPQPRFPWQDRFIQADALEYVAAHGHEYDAIASSPPCQGYSENMKHLSHTTPKLIDHCRDLLTKIGKPWIIENVEGAPLATDTTLFGDHGVLLCGSHFGLRIWRHRLFETSFPVRKPGPCRHNAPPLNPHRKESRHRMRREFGCVDLEKIWRAEVGVEWMDKASGRQAIPPAYTEFVGKQLRDILLNRQDEKMRSEELQETILREGYICQALPDIADEFMGRQLLDVLERK